MGRALLGLGAVLGWGALLGGCVGGGGVLIFFTVSGKLSQGKNR